jgi:hypothetical protein
MKQNYGRYTSAVRRNSFGINETKFVVMLLCNVSISQPVDLLLFQA